MRTEPCITWLKALADETRWRIVRELLTEPLTVSGLVERLNVTQYNISKHLKVLRRAGIVEGKRHGRRLECAVVANLRGHLQKGQNCLNLGCCTFCFNASSTAIFHGIRFP
jgi:DNA-binding transcriptional ArsR family regulator